MGRCGGGNSGFRVVRMENNLHSCRGDLREGVVELYSFACP